MRNSATKKEFDRKLLQLKGKNSRDWEFVKLETIPKVGYQENEVVQAVKDECCVYVCSLCSEVVEE